MSRVSMRTCLVRAGFRGFHGRGVLAATNAAQLLPTIQQLASRFGATVPLADAGIDNDESPMRLVLLAADSAGVADVVRSIRDISSLPSIFLLASREARLTRHLPALAMAGLDQLFEMGDHDRLDQLEEVMRRCARSSGDLSTSLGSVDDLASEAEVVVQWCVRNGYRALRAADVASHFAVDRKTLYRLLRRAGTPTVSELLHEGRVAHAAALRRDGFSYTQIAGRLGYASASSVAMLLRRRS